MGCLVAVFLIHRVVRAGSVSVTGQFELVNEAARLGGEFSRIPFSIDKWGSSG